MTRLPFQQITSFFIFVALSSFLATFSHAQVPIINPLDYINLTISEPIDFSNNSDYLLDNGHTGYSQQTARMNKNDVPFENALNITYQTKNKQGKAICGGSIRLQAISHNADRYMPSVYNSPLIPIKAPGYLNVDGKNKVGFFELSGRVLEESWQLDENGKKVSFPREYYGTFSSPILKLNKVSEWKYQALTPNFKGTKWSDLRLKYDVPPINQQWVLAVERTMDGFEAIDCSKDTSGVCANYKGRTVNDYCKYANGSKGAYGASLGTLFINKMRVGSGIKNLDCITFKAKPVAGSKNGKVGEYSPLGLGLQLDYLMAETYDGFSAAVGKPYYIPHNKIDDFCEITKDRTTFSAAVFADVIKKLPVTINK